MHLIVEGGEDGVGQGRKKAVNSSQIRFGRGCCTLKKLLSGIGGKGKGVLENQKEIVIGRDRRSKARVLGGKA